MPTNPIQKPAVADATFVRKNVLTPGKKKKKAPPPKVPSSISDNRYNPDTDGNRYSRYDGPVLH